MDKKAVYEHLAKIYLDASLKRKGGSKKQHIVLKNFLFISIPFLGAIAIFFFILSHKNFSKNSELALVIQPESVKINFNFYPAKKEIYTVNLNRLNLAHFRALSFSARKTNYQDNVNLRVEFTSKFKEKSAVYLKNIPHKWQSYKIELADFKDISEWSEILTLSFIVEEWNTKEKNGVVYLDNIVLLR